MPDGQTFEHYFDALKPLPEPAAGGPDDPSTEAGRPSWQRQIVRLDAPPAIVDQPRLSLEDARRFLRQRVADYLAERDPEYALVLAVTPGVGKSTIAVQAAETAAAMGRVVGYLGPRRDFFGDLMELAQRPQWWQPWDARQDGSNDRRKTCLHALPMAKWLAKGHKAIDFCVGVCGWAYINDRDHGCAWHAQKEDKRPIVFGQHQHLVAGHPREFGVVIVDESAIGVFTRQWIIGEKWIMPADMDDAEPMTEIMHTLATWAGQGLRIFGKPLLDGLGGAQRVLDACESMPLDAEALDSPPIYRPDDAERAPYMHLPWVIHLLAREARVALEGQDYPARVIVDDGKLHLLLRQTVNKRMPKHRIILDATANRDLLETLLRQPVEIVEPMIRRQGRIFQVTDRANNKSTMLDAALAATAKAKQAHILMKRLVEQRRYQRVGIITYQALEDQFPDWEVGHFGGSRGTNRFDQVEALFVLGTPMPDMGELLKVATMLYQNRMEPFAASARPEFVTVTRAFAYRDADGKGWGYPVSEFADPDLNAVLWQHRDAEIIQAVHRARINIRPADVWLFANIPIDQLPPDCLFTFRDLMGSPLGMDVWRWPEIEEILDWFHEAGEVLPRQMFLELIKARPDTTSGYMRIIAKTWPDRWRLRRARDALPGDPIGAGRKPAVLIPSTSRYWGENGN